MNHNYTHQHKIKKTSLVSSRRGRNFLLHNLEKTDVVFGTKGNGRNEIFLKVLESHSEKYMQLSKFQKMGLIQKIIRDWKGNFYIMNCKTNDLCLAKKMNHDLSTTDPYSRKLYTSVRRMMNYVNSKIQRQPYHPVRRKNDDPPAMLSTSSMEGLTIQASHLSSSTSMFSKKEQEKKFIENTSMPHVESAKVAVQKKSPTVLTATDYIRKDRVTLPPPHKSLLTLSFSPTSMSILSPKQSAMMVTPEPSPRALVQNPLPISPLPFSKPLLSLNGMAVPLPHFELSNANMIQKNDPTYLYSRKQSSASTIINTTNKIHSHFLPADNTIGDMEESAILALTRLSSLPSIISS